MFAAGSRRGPAAVSLLRIVLLFFLAIQLASAVPGPRLRAREANKQRGGRAPAPRPAPAPAPRPAPAPAPKPAPKPAPAPKPGNTPPVIDSVAAAAKFVVPPPKDKGMFWSGIPFEKSQEAATKNGLKTLEQSVLNEIISQPDAVPKTVNNPIFWDRFSQAYSDTLVSQKHTTVTVALRAPNKVLTGPAFGGSWPGRHYNTLKSRLMENAIEHLR